jgi:hypothetical protein
VTIQPSSFLVTNCTNFLELNAKIRAIRAIRDQRVLTAESLLTK